MTKKKQKEPVLTCPNCASDQVTLSHVQMFMANTLQHYCHSVKTQDSDSKSICLDCNWRGRRNDLKEQLK